MGILKLAARSSFGGLLGANWQLSQYRAQIPVIDAFEEELKALSDGEMRKRSLALRFRAKCQEPLDLLLPEAFALVREAGRRRLNMRHYEVQLLGGQAIHDRSIAEMQTGEGKTLTATLPMYLNALSGHGAHLATVNDYLARRDAEWMQPIYELLGMSVGVIESQMPTAARRRAYSADVTYGTAKEFGFDFLRDRLLLRKQREHAVDFLGGLLGQQNREDEQPVQREPNFALVDEADSVLIDDAGTPLIISALPTDEEKLAAECYRWSHGVIDQFEEDEDYDYDHEERRVELTATGRKKARVLPQPAVMHTVGVTSIYEYIERAIKVKREYLLDRHYVIRDGEIQIVDEFTGRIAEGRKWRDGIHQAVEAQENVTITTATGQAARVTVQEFFLRYPHLGGMTGTAFTSASELRKIYRVNVLRIPTNRPAIRQKLPDAVFGTSADRWQAIIAEVREIHATGRPVLIGTRSIDKSEIISKLLRKEGIEHQVLNARNEKSEAEIVAQAGQRNRVTVATNMAGRGTDIRLGDDMKALGGLHVICTEIHDSARIDRQLIGRCGRQGDPGTYRQYMALDDDILLAGLGPEKADRLKEIGLSGRGSYGTFAKTFWRAQQYVEHQRFRQRRVLMYHERERNKLQRAMGLDPYLDTPG